MFYLDVPFMCIYALVSIINNTIQYNTIHVNKYLYNIYKASGQLFRYDFLGTRQVLLSNV